MPKKSIPQIAYVIWLDASATEAAEPNTPVDHQLARLQEAGFLIGETDTTLTLGMELEGDESTTPGRWRITVPKSQIVELHLVPVTSFRKKASRAR